TSTSNIWRHGSGVDCGETAAGLVWDKNGTRRPKEEQQRPEETDKIMPQVAVTPCLTDSPLGAADGPRRPCFNHSETEVRRSPPRADRRARPWPSPYAALKASTSPPPTRAYSLSLSLSVHSPS